MFALVSANLLPSTAPLAQRATSRGTPQAPALPGAISTSSHDRVYTGDQTSNTESVIDPGTNTFLDTIAPGDPRPGVLGALYKKEIDVHGSASRPTASCSRRSA